MGKEKPGQDTMIKQLPILNDTQKTADCDLPWFSSPITSKFL